MSWLWGWKQSQMQCTRPSFISPERKNILAISRTQKTMHGFSRPEEGAGCVQVPGSEWILPKDHFIVNSCRILWPWNFLGISHPMIVFTGQAVGSEGSGGENRMENSVAKDSDLEGKSWMPPRSVKGIVGWPCCMRTDNIPHESHDSSFTEQGFYLQDLC